MKTIRFFALCAVLAMTSCGKMEMDSSSERVYDEKGRVVFDARAEESLKTNLDDFPSVNWEYSDVLKVYHGGKSADFVPVEGSISGSSASFAGEIILGEGNTYAVCPSSAAEGCTDGVITVTLPQRQYVGTGRTVDPSAMLSVAFTSSRTLVFKNMTALLKVTVTASDITGIVVESGNGECISGKVQVTVPSDGGTPYVSSVIDGKSLVDLRPADFGCFTPGVYYLPVLPATLSAGIKVGVRKAGCNEWTRSTTSVTGFVRNGGHSFAAADITGSGAEPQLLARQLNDIKEAGADGLSVKLANDIDMAGQSVAGVPFKGSLDGDGHNIYNFKAEGSENVGFFSVIDGDAVIKNVKFGTGDGETYDGVSVITPNSASGTVYAGIVARVESDASLTVKDVANFAPITTAGTPTVSYVGGLIGGADGPIDIDGAENNGAIVIKATGKVYTGGIVGDILASGTISIKNTTNNAPLTCSAETSGQTYLGGLVGRGQNAAQTVNLDHCVNNGRICNSKCASGTMYCAGMVGNIGTGSSPTVTGKINYTDCINNGEVENKVKVGMRLAGFTASVYGVQKATDCVNNGAVIASLANTTTDIGGFIGKNTGDAGGAYTRCTNNGAIIIRNSVSSSGALTAGGIIGNSKSHTLTDCKNTGNIIVDNGSQKVKTIYAGGLAGYLSGTGTFKISSGGVCKSECVVSATNVSGSGSVKNCGLICGYAKTIKATNCGVAGTINGTALDASNWKDYIFGGATTSTGVIKDGSSTSCYYCGTATDPLTTIKVGTFNIWRPSARVSDRKSNPDISEGRLWPNAVDGVAQAIVDMDCDIIGFNEINQEVWNHASLTPDKQMPAQVDALNGGVYTWQLKFPNYADGSYSFCNGFAYKTARFEVVDGPVRIWHNNKTGEYQTTAKDGARTLVYVKFKEKASGKMFWFASTHLDLTDETVCRNCAASCVKWAEDIVGHDLPCILAGDMNCASVSIRPKGISTLKGYWKDAFEILRSNGLLDNDSFNNPASRPGSSKIGTNSSAEKKELAYEYNRYDHIMTDGFTPVSYSTNRGSYTNGFGTFWYSDHFPITATLRF